MEVLEQFNHKQKQNRLGQNKNIWRCDLKGTPCIKACESEKYKHICGITMKDNYDNSKTNKRTNTL